jgi:hypothetical protein
MSLMLRYGSGEIHGGEFPSVWILHAGVIGSKQAGCESTFPAGNDQTVVVN